jgi:hypothetical protein
MKGTCRLSMCSWTVRPTAPQRMWNNPLSRIVSKDSPSESRRSASSTWNVVAPRSAALRRAMSIVHGETSMPRAMAPRLAAKIVCSPVPQLASSRSARVGEAEKFGPWAADFPGWRRVLVKLVPFLGRTGCCHAIILAEVSELGDLRVTGISTHVPNCPNPGSFPGPSCVRSGRTLWDSPHAVRLLGSSRGKKCQQTCRKNLIRSSGVN